MAAFSSQEDLEEWLSDNPAEWAGVLAQRIALRVFPFIPISTADIDTPLRRFTHQSWRVLLISSVAPNIPAEDIRAASFTDGSLDARAALAGRVALDAPLDNLYTRYVLDADATWLEENGDPAGLAARPLWPDGMPQAFQEIWQDARPALAASLPLIADWYDRRLQGAATAFNLPPDADLAVIQRLAAAREELWDLEPRAINDTIAGWIEEARAAIKPSNGPLDDPSELAAIAATLSQPVPYALTYTEGADGRLHIDDRALANNLAHDADAVSRYETLRRLAQRLLDACQSAGGNAVAGLTPDVVWLLDSLGEELAAAKPHDLVTATIILRNTLDQQEEQRAARDPDPDLPVYPELVRGALKNLVPQANMVLGLDPYLYEIERAMRRGTNEPQIAPAEGQQAAKGAVDARVLGDEVPQRLADITRDAPQVPDPENPASRRATREYMALFLSIFGKLANIAVFLLKNAANIKLLFEWVKENYDTLKRLFLDNETVQRLLEYLRDIF